MCSYASQMKIFEDFGMGGDGCGMGEYPSHKNAPHDMETPFFIGGMGGMGENAQKHLEIR